MNTVTRIVPALVVLFVIAAFAGVSAASAQAASLPVAQAQTFLGDWAVALDAQGQSFTLTVDIKDVEGNVAADVGSDMSPTTRAQSVSRTGENLVVSFSMDAQGQQIPVVITLTPDGDALNASVDFAGGMFVATGKGTRR
jgi:invasion protein IalB